MYPDEVIELTSSNIERIIEGHEPFFVKSYAEGDWDYADERVDNAITNEYFKVGGSFFIKQTIDGLRTVYDERGAIYDRITDPTEVNVIEISEERALYDCVDNLTDEDFFTIFDKSRDDTKNRIFLAPDAEERLSCTVERMNKEIRALGVVDLIPIVSDVSIPGKDGKWYLTNVMKRNDNIYLNWMEEEYLYGLPRDTVLGITTNTDLAIVTEAPWGCSEWEKHFDEIDPIVKEKSIPSFVNRLSEGGRHFFGKFTDSVLKERGDGHDAEPATYVKAERPTEAAGRNYGEEMER
jgi:hypothetical protein